MDRMRIVGTTEKLKTAERDDNNKKPKKKEKWIKGY